MVKTGQNIADLLKGDPTSAIQRSEEFRPEVERYQKLEKGAKREIGTKLEVGAGVAALKNLLMPQGAGQAVVDVATKARSLTPKSVLGGKQAQAAVESTAKPLIDDFVRVGKDLASKDPDVAKEFIKQEPFLKTIKTMPDLLDRMQVWGRRAFKAGGSTKAAAKAELYADFYGEGINQLKNLAPEVYKQRQLLRLTFELPKKAGKALWRLTLGKILVN